MRMCRAVAGLMRQSMMAVSEVVADMKEVKVKRQIGGKQSLGAPGSSKGDIGVVVW